jgi:hypothetical protein
LTIPPTSPPPATNDTTLVLTPLHRRHAVARAAAPPPYTASSYCKAHFSTQTLEGTIPRQVGTILVAIPKQTDIDRSGWRVSSVYSRDTKGVSILHDPTCAPVISDKGGTNPRPNEPSLGRANSTDLVWSNNDWNLHAGDLHRSIPPIADWPRSDVGPRSPPLHIDSENPAPLGSCPQENGHTIFGLTVPIPKILVGRPSDDVFCDGGSVQSRGRMLRNVLDMDMAGTESSISGYCGKTAPGGAE